MTPGFDAIRLRGTYVNIAVWETQVRNLEVLDPTFQMLIDAGSGCTASRTIHDERYHIETLGCLQPQRFCGSDEVHDRRYETSGKYASALSLTSF